MNTRNLDDQVESTENGSIEVTSQFQDAATTTSVAAQKEINAEQLGRVYFIRHGESTSNERNIFAGVLDVARRVLTQEEDGISDGASALAENHARFQIEADVRSDHVRLSGTVDAVAFGRVVAVVDLG